ncbi:MAG TPA: lipoyl(octanoyl) transferase LipB [Fimbriimonadaceae bacterium]|nr:lipoyl(octanoyl) transferase LipB [Fimbriimonadaceae bacterium]
MTGRSIDLGRMGYNDAWDVQKRVAEEVVGGAPDTLLFVEHDAVMTLGASFHEDNLLLPVSEYARHGIEVVRTDRGGDVTFHGPDQLVVYPVFDLRRHGKDLHKWMRDLEECVIVACAELGLRAGREPEVNTGVWIDGLKVAAIGVKIRKWVSIHGIAINCDNDLSPFGLIVPCGVKTHGVTSLSRAAGKVVTNEDALLIVKRAFESVFGLELQDVDRAEVLAQHD